ncbi:MAG: ABC transporter permease subunit, partial [Dehalococcoidia bacterium]|nr:ABC transporter permease subunit [Dehalococcoidia bacterium]
VVTVVGMMVPALIGGTVIIEQIFALPGVGLLMFQALSSRDYPILSGVNVFLAMIVLVANLMVDVTYGWLDPRVKFK